MASRFSSRSVPGTAVSKWRPSMDSVIESLARDFDGRVRFVRKGSTIRTVGNPKSRVDAMALKGMGFHWSQYFKCWIRR